MFLFRKTILQSKVDGMLAQGSFLIVLLVSIDALTLKSNIKDHWHKFKAAHNKDYHPHVDNQKKTIFLSNVKKILDHNIRADLGLHDHRLGINKYADMDHAEFVLKMNGFSKKFSTRRLSRSNVHKVRAAPEDLPAEVDWVKAGRVTEVKDQKECGSCWAFSAVGAVEGAWQKKTGELKNLSVQNLVDCADTKYDNNGCDGGLPENAFRYIIKNNGINNYDCYPYFAVKSECYFNTSCEDANIIDYGSVDQGDEDALMEALATVGPISIAIDASQDSFQLYKDGIFSDPNCDPDSIDHAVLLVGYGTEDDKPYWLVKNSWGTTWGKNGYFKIARNAGNMCGIASYNSYPII